MSLDVYLKVEEPILKKEGSGIFIRQNGQTIEISPEEWNRLHPYEAYEGEISKEDGYTDTVFHWNITHNLNKMARAAGIYMELWRPDEMDFPLEYAKELINPLRKALHKLKKSPEKYKKYNPENGWGNYEGLVKFIENYLNACYEFPNAKIKISR